MTTQTRSALNAQADTLIEDNTSGNVSAEDVRTNVKDLADSAFLAEDFSGDSQLVTAAEKAAIASNTAKVSNATHTGDVTGSTVLTIATDAVDIAMLSATGTASSTTFLRGDNTWNVPAGGGDMTIATYDPTAVSGDAFDMDSMVEGTALILTGAERSAISANTAKVTNATHTGDVTGGTALTIAAGAVDIAMMSATGTASGTTYLRGDNTWASIAGGTVTEYADDVFRVQDNADATKEIAFQASGIGTGNTRTITMPDDDVDLGAFTTTVDLASNTNLLGASLIGIEDSTGNFTATEVEGALAELYPLAVALTGSGSPAGVVTPSYVGQRYTDTGTTPGTGYNALGATSGDWSQDIDEDTGSAIGTKGTPIAADNVLHFDSASSDAPVNSTWTQIIAAFGFLRAAVTSNLTAAFTTTSSDLGTKSSGTETLTFSGSNVQRIINGGAFTLAPPSSGEGTIVLDILNNGSAGAITTSGFSSVSGDAFTTTNTEQFICTIARINSVSYLIVNAHSGNA